MRILLSIVMLAAAPAFAQVWWATNEITGVVAPSTFLTFGAGPMRVTLTAHDGGVPIDLSEETVRLIVQDRGDMKAVYSNVATRVSGSTYRGEATLTASTNQYDVRMVLFPQGDPINYYPIYWARVTVTSIPETVTLNSLGNVLLNASNNLVAPAAASNTVLTAMGDGTVKFEPAASGGGGPTTGQVNLVTINGTNYQGDLALEASGLLRLAPTGNTINAYVGDADVFAGLQSYASPLTNVIAWNVGGQPIIMSPLVPGYQLTTDGSNWYLGADAAGTAFATNSVYQFGHNGSIIGPVQTLLFEGSPISIAALGGGTGVVYVAGDTNDSMWAMATFTTGTVTYAAGTPKSFMPTGSTSHILYYGRTNLINGSTWAYTPGIPGEYRMAATMADGSGVSINFIVRLYCNDAEWWPYQAANVLGGVLAVDSGNAAIRAPEWTFFDATGTNSWTARIETVGSAATAFRGAVVWYRKADYTGGLP